MSSGSRTPNGLKRPDGYTQDARGFFNLLVAQRHCLITCIPEHRERVAPGTASFRSSSRLALSSVAGSVIPVMFPPGRARLVTKPVPTASPAATNTIGMVEVASFAALAEGAPSVSSRSMLRPTSSVASAGSAARSFPSAPPACIDDVLIDDIAEWLKRPVVARQAERAVRWSCDSRARKPMCPDSLRGLLRQRGERHDEQPLGRCCR